MDGSITILDGPMRKLPSSRKLYQVRLIVSANGLPIIEYQRRGGHHFVVASSRKKRPAKTIEFVDLLFADKKHDTSEKWAFSIYSTNKTVTFLPQDEAAMNEWLNKIRQLHSELYPEFKCYDAIFEANLLGRGLASKMHIQGHYRVALCKQSLDLIPMDLNETATSSTRHQASAANHHNLPCQYLAPNHQHQSFCKSHPMLASRIIELVLRSIRRCGHKESKFFIESGRHSQIGEGHLWIMLPNKSTARHLHELLLATMRLAPEEGIVQMSSYYKRPRSRSGGSSSRRKLDEEEEENDYLPMA